MAPDVVCGVKTMTLMVRMLCWHVPRSLLGYRKERFVLPVNCKEDKSVVKSVLFNGTKDAKTEACGDSWRRRSWNGRTASFLGETNLIGHSLTVSQSCAATLAEHPEKFRITVIERSPVAGGQALSIPLDEKRFGASWLNNGVQGGSPVG